MPALIDIRRRIRSVKNTQQMIYALGFWDQIMLAWPAMVGIGIFAGGGMGLGYACPTPAAIKWC